ncbi:hypothetical protein BRC95_07750 [Halobacteriales archaeon QS_5_68_33]|nr:MAG: hypothetical protein BRC95_07750 [Halobacteriales archaeon QS_5_68_33]
MAQLGGEALPASLREMEVLREPLFELDAAALLLPSLDGATEDVSTRSVSLSVRRGRSGIQANAPGSPESIGKDSYFIGRRDCIDSRVMIM